MEWLIRMKEALDYMESKMEESVTIDEIAKVAYSSPFISSACSICLPEYLLKTISVSAD